MSERLAFVQACLDRTETIASICDRFGISEKTGHKWLRRFRRGGAEDLIDRSHAPQHHKHRVTAAVTDAIIRLRRKYPDYGPVKLRDWLVQHTPEQHWPAASTIGELLHRTHLSRRRRRRSAAARQLESQCTAATAANLVWTADFKGQFRLQSGRWCYPLTVLDLYSHYLLRCTALPSTAVRSARQVFARLFAEYGLPEVIRTDNGVPFAQPNALGRLGALAFWWIRLGIRPEHIRPGRPAENGAHERFHKTLNASLRRRPVAASLLGQQRRFDRFRAEYNVERPHESLPGHLPPAKLYEPTQRPYPRRLPALDYPSAAQLRLVSANGTIRWHNHELHLSHNLAGQYVALSETPSQLLTISYGWLALGEFDPHLGRFRASVRWMTVPPPASIVMKDPSPG